MSAIKFPQSLKAYLPDSESQKHFSTLCIIIGLLVIIGSLSITDETFSFNTSFLMFGVVLLCLPFLIYCADNQQYLPHEAIIDISNVEWSEPAKARLQEIVSIKAEKLKLKDLREILKTEEKYQKYQEEIKENERVKEAISNIMK